MKRVLVTGANGHLGNTIAQTLVQRGYAVRVSVRDVKSVQRSGLFSGLNVELVQADMIHREQMREAAEGMDGLFHVAAVFRHWAKDPQKEIIEPNLVGIENILFAAERAGVKKVIYTSSVAAVGFLGTREHPLDESCWQQKKRHPYMLAKTLAEKKAWEIAQRDGIAMVSICPGSIIGPNFTRITPTIAPFLALLKGTLPGIPPLSLDCVDVRDVALAHILAYENPRAHGRYICDTQTFTFAELIETIARLRPSLKIPTRTIPYAALPVIAGMDFMRHWLKGAERSMTLATVLDYYGSANQRYFNTDKIRQELGWKPRGIEESIMDTFAWLEKDL